MMKKFCQMTHLKLDLCDLINADDMLAIRTADENFPFYIMKSTTCVVQLRKSYVDKKTNGDRSLVLVIKYGYTINK